MSQSSTGIFEVDLPDSFEERLALARRVRGWNQTQLGDACRSVGLQMGQSAISDMEKGKRRANALERAVLAEVLRVPADYFFITPETHPSIAKLSMDELSVLLRDIRWYCDPSLSPAGTAA